MLRVLLIALSMLFGSTLAATPALAENPALNAKLCDAMQKDDAAGVTAQVKLGANPNASCAIAECAWADCKKLPKPTVAPALYFAVKKDLTGSVGALLDAGALPNAPEAKYGMTPLFKIRSAATAELLFTHGADVSLRDKNGDPPLYALVGRIGSDKYGLTQEQATEILKLLTGHGADINVKDKTGGTVLLSAVTAGYPVFVTALLDQGADVNAHDNQGNTALGLAKRWEGEPMLATTEAYQQIEALLRAHGAAD